MSTERIDNNPALSAEEPEAQADSQIEENTAGAADNATVLGRLDQHDVLAFYTVRAHQIGESLANGEMDKARDLYHNLRQTLPTEKYAGLYSDFFNRLERAGASGEVILAFYKALEATQESEQPKSEPESRLPEDRTVTEVRVPLEPMRSTRVSPGLPSSERVPKESRQEIEEEYTQALEAIEAEYTQACKVIEEEYAQEINRTDETYTQELAAAEAEHMAAVREGKGELREVFQKRDLQLRRAFQKKESLSREAFQRKDLQLREAFQKKESKSKEAFQKKESRSREVNR